MSTKEVILHSQQSQAGQLVRAEDFMPFQVDAVVARKNALNEVIEKVLIDDVDYGVQPGSASKQKVLKKAGAEKLMSTFGLAAKIVNEIKVQDWTGADHGGEPFFYHEYTIALYRGDQFRGEAIGSCNSWEKKFRYQWVSEEEAQHLPGFEKFPKRGGRRTVFAAEFAVQNKETGGPYGKPMEYWERFEAAIRAGTARKITKEGKKGKPYTAWEIEIDETQIRIPNPNSADLVNTVQKLGFKRSLVAAVLVVTNCSDAFTQDLEEGDEEHPRKSTPDQEQDGPVMSAAEEMERESRRSPAPAAEVGRGPSTGPGTMPTTVTAPVATASTPAGSAAFDAPPAPNTRSAPTPKVAPKKDEPAPNRGTRGIPEDMWKMIEDVRANPGKNISVAYRLLWEQASKRGEPCAMSHEDLNEKYRTKFPKGSRVTIEDVVDQMLDLYEDIQRFPEVLSANATAPRARA